MHRHRLETTRTDGRRNDVVDVELRKAPAAMPRRAACSSVVYTSSQNIKTIYLVDDEVSRRRWKRREKKENEMNRHSRVPFSQRRME